MSESFTKPVVEDKIATMFDRIAPRYDFLNRFLSCRQDKTWRRSLISFIPKGRKLKLLDVATGTADILIEAKRQLGDDVVLHGSDISEKMLALGRTKLDRLGIKTNGLSLMSAERMEYSDQSFDVITISFGLRNVVDKDKAISEFSRLLKPQGQLLVLEFFAPEKKTLAKAFQFYFHHILPVIGGAFSDKQAYSYLPKSVASSYSIDALTAVMANKGLKTGRIKSFLFGACRIVEGIKV
jgi:demethylmenaquinone methyltransferase/2-methoxy-6-polyprenyl-1,4-benzoquinol methylase